MIRHSSPHLHDDKQAPDCGTLRRENCPSQQESDFHSGEPTDTFPGPRLVFLEDRVAPRLSNFFLPSTKDVLCHRPHLPLPRYGIPESNRLELPQNCFGLRGVLFDVQVRLATQRPSNPDAQAPSNGFLTCGRRSVPRGFFETRCIFGPHAFAPVFGLGSKQVPDPFTSPVFQWEACI